MVHSNTVTQTLSVDISQLSLFLKDKILASQSDQKCSIRIIYNKNVLIEVCMHYHIGTYNTFCFSQPLHARVTVYINICFKLNWLDFDFSLMLPDLDGARVISAGSCTCH